MEVRATEIKSGAFIVLAVGVFAVLLFAVGDIRERIRAKATYYAYLPDAKFLKTTDAVTYGGIRVGEISRIEVSPERFGHVKVTITIQPEIEVREDSKLVLKQDGMLGAKYLEIMPGTPEAKRARPGTELNAEVIPAITDLSAAIRDPLLKIDQLLAGLNKVLNSPENQRNLSEILGQFREMLTNLKEDLHRLAESAVKTSDEARNLLHDVDQTLNELKPSVQRILDRVDELTAKLSATADTLNALLRDADALVAQNSRNVYETIRALRDTAYQLEMASKRI
ncbi:MAG: MCE family protein, partial [Planctomycetes bacterium]|nr:MCE family protein [Planctomycetota bacterium]